MTDPTTAKALALIEREIERVGFDLDSNARETICNIERRNELLEARKNLVRLSAMTDRPLSLSERARIGGNVTRDGWAAEFQRRTGENWYAHISPGGKRRPRHQLKESGVAAGRGGRVARIAAEGAEPIDPFRFS